MELPLLILYCVKLDRIATAYFVNIYALSLPGKWSCTVTNTEDCAKRDGIATAYFAFGCEPSLLEPVILSSLN